MRAFELIKKNRIITKIMTETSFNGHFKIKNIAISKSNNRQYSKHMMLQNSSRHRLRIVVGSCLFYFLLGLPMCCGGGIHLFKVCYDDDNFGDVCVVSFLQFQWGPESKPGDFRM